MSKNTGKTSPAKNPVPKPNPLKPMATFKGSQPASRGQYRPKVTPPKLPKK